MERKSITEFLPKPLELATTLLPGTIVEWNKDIMPIPKDGFVVQQKFFRSKNGSYFDKIRDLRLLSRKSHSDTPEMEAIPFHNRTLGTNTTILADLGLYYIDAKSTGNYRRFEGDNDISIFKGNIENKRGLADLTSSIYDHRMQIILAKLGVRTHTSIGVVVPKENLIGYLKTPNNNTSNPDEIFAQQIRAYPTPYRIEELISNKAFGIENKKILNNALLSYSMQTGKPVDIDTKDPFIISTQIEQYLLWIAKCVGDSVGRMHANGFAHRYLHLGNVTVDGRIVDLDSVSSIADEGIARNWSTKINKDRLDMIRITRILISTMQRMYPSISRFQVPKFETEILNNLQYHYKKHRRKRNLIELHRKEGWTERQVMHDLDKIITNIQQLHSR